MEKSWYTYLVRCSDNTLYCGITTDPDKRVHDHNFTKRGAKYCKSRLPVCLVYLERYESKSEAAKRESAIKKLYKKDKENLIENWHGELGHQASVMASVVLQYLNGPKNIVLIGTDHQATYFKEGNPYHKITYGGKLIAAYISREQDLFLARALDKAHVSVQKVNWSHRAAYVVLHEIAHALVYCKGLRKKGISHGTDFYQELKVLLDKYWNFLAHQFALLTKTTFY